MHSDTSHVQCSTHEQFAARFAALDPFWNDSGQELSNFEARFSTMAREYAARSPHLRNWIGNGNQLPKVYCD